MTKISTYPPAAEVVAILNEAASIPPEVVEVVNRMCQRSLQTALEVIATVNGESVPIVGGPVACVIGAHRVVEARPADRVVRPSEMQRVLIHTGSPPDPPSFCEGAPRFPLDSWRSLLADDLVRRAIHGVEAVDGFFDEPEE